MDGEPLVDRERLPVVEALDDALGDWVGLTVIVLLWLCVRVTESELDVDGVALLVCVIACDELPVWLVDCVEDTVSDGLVVAF